MLEWKHIIDRTFGSVWKSGKWRIMVDGESRHFYVVGYWENKFPTFPAAAAWCEEQDRLDAQLEIPLPKPGDVWGHPDKRETRRLVHRISDDGVWFAGLGYGVDRSTDWQSWVRESGAVELVGDREALAARVKELEGDDWGARVQSAVNAGWESDVSLSEFITRLAKELDAAKASRDRLLEGLRRIRDGGGPWSGAIAHEVLAAEEGVEK